MNEFIFQKRKLLANSNHYFTENFSKSSKENISIPSSITFANKGRAGKKGGRDFSSFRHVLF